MMVRSQQMMQTPIKEKTMPGRTRRTAAPAEPVAETPAETEAAASAKRGPGPLQDAHCAWLKAEYGVDIDPEHLYLAQTTRREFRESDQYEAFLEAEDKRKEEAEQAKAKRAEERAAAAKAEPATEEPAEAKPARRGRAAKAAAPATEQVAEAAAEPAKPARRSRATKAAAAPAAEAPATEAAPAKRTRGARTPAPF